MGNNYFLKNYTNYRGEILKKDSREDLIISCEDLYGLIGDGSALDILKGTYGIWFYESDLWNKEHLKQKLRELIDDLDKFKPVEIKFQKLINEWKQSEKGALDEYDGILSKLIPELKDVTKLRKEEEKQRRMSK